MQPYSTVAELQTALDDSPFHQLFDLRITEADRAAGLLRIDQHYTPSVERLAGSGQYHGGVIASLIDITGDFALILTLGHGVPTINFRVDFLRPATATDLHATARVRRVGRTVGIVDIDVEDDGYKLIAVGRGCYGTASG